MLTIFTVPKAFDGMFGAIQRTAIRSWLEAIERAQVVLVGDDSGVADTASEFGILHLGGVARTDAGTPRLDDAFGRVETIATYPLRCFVNADIILTPQFAEATRRVLTLDGPLLAVGRSWDLDLSEPPEFSPRGWTDLEKAVGSRGRSRGVTAIDYFLFTPGLFDPIPPFAVGRARFDNWLVWRARQRGWVVDLTDAVRPVHQHHDYAHLPGGFREAHFGPEADVNETLAGGSRCAYTIHDASHRMRADGAIVRNLGSVLRAREHLRKAAWKLGRRHAAPVASR